MVLDWYPTTTLTTPDDCEKDSNEQPVVIAAAATTTDASQATGRFIKDPGVQSFSANEIGHVHRHRAGWAAGRARAAVPAFVDGHEGVAGFGVDGQRVERTDPHAERAAVDTQRLVDRHRHVRAVVVDQGHGLLLIGSALLRFPRMVIRSPRMRMYSRSTGVPSARPVSRSSISSAAPSGTSSVAAECASAGMASSASDAEPSRCPLTCSMSANRSSVSSEWLSTSIPIFGARQVAEIAQPLDEHRLLAWLQPQPAGDRRRGGDRHGGPHLVADLAEVFER